MSLLTCGIVAAVARLNSADDVDIIGEVGVNGGQGKRGGEGKLLPLLGLHSSMAASHASGNFSKSGHASL